MIHLLAAYASAGILNGEVTLSGHTVSADDIGAGAGSCEAGFRFNADGTIDQKDVSGGGAAVYTPIDTGTDWIFPNEASYRSYWVRATETNYVETETAIALLSGVKNGGTGTWWEIGDGNSKEWSLVTASNTAGTGNITWTVTFEIATDSGGADIVASGSYTMNGVV